MPLTGRVWRDGVRQDGDITPDRAAELLADPALLTWVDLTGDDDVRALAPAIGMDASAVEDALGERERVKLHRYVHNWFITAYSSRSDPDGGLVCSQVSAFVLPHGLVTIHRDGFDVDALAARWDDSSAELRLGVGALVHGFLDQVVDGHFETLQALDEVIDDTEALVFADGPRRAFPEQIHHVRSRLAQLRRVVLPLREVVAAIQRHRLLPPEFARRRPSDERPPPPQAGLADALRALDESDIVIAPELDPLFDDLYDHVLRAMEWTESLRDLVASIFETHLALQNARLNDVMKKLAGWAAIIAVPTAITGWFGMNVPYWGFGEVSGLIASVVLIVVLGLGLFGVMRHFDWV